ncbi:MAG: hypothetical protein IPJ65_39905 [Archangiaceae bacterium]|nr:hypothetical protein [Archangiaceae bacterium]
MRSKELAALALEKLPEYGAPPRPGLMRAGDDLALGAVYALGERPEQALPYLRSVTRSCFALDDPFVYVTALDLEGEALAARGDLAGARAAWQRIVELWGKAQPPSVRAQAAAARLEALGFEAKP